MEELSPPPQSLSLANNLFFEILFFEILFFERFLIFLLEVLLFWFLELFLNSFFFLKVVIY